MHTAIARFLQFLAVERNASNYTVKSYREDLTPLAEYLAEAYGGQPPGPGDMTVFDLRGYVAALHEAGYAKTTIARHLASLRSFFRFGQREGWAKTNPAKPLRNPRKGRSLPHFLSADELGRLSSPAGRRADGPARSGDPGNDVLGRAPCERGRRLGRERLGFRRPACFASAARAAANALRPSDRTPCGVAALAAMRAARWQRMARIALCESSARPRPAPMVTPAPSPPGRCLSINSASA